MKENPTLYKASQINSPQIKQFIPELKLWEAVLLRAADDLHLKDWKFESKYHLLKNARLRREAIAWFKSSRTHVGSFLWICDVFSLHPDIVRSIILSTKLEISMQWRETRGNE